jgi:hypothetical protein
MVPRVGPLIVMATSAAAGIAFSQLSLFFVFVPLWTRTLTASSTPRRKMTCDGDPLS